VSGSIDPAASDPDPRPDRSVRGLANYVYGTISTLVAIAGLTYEKHPGALTTAGVVVVGAVSIWLAHALSQLVITESWQTLTIRWEDIRDELRGSWAIVSAALPATLIFLLAEAHLWTVGTAFVLAEVVGVLALAVVGIGTAGRRSGSPARRTVYVLGLVGVGVVIVGLELITHLL
jgi:hypothetical protein